MRSILTVLFATFVFLCSAQQPSIEQLKKADDQIKKTFHREQPKEAFVSKSLFVDPFIGTGGHGHTYPGASAPFGMIQLSPDTRHDGWDGCSGYHFSDSVIYGFSHTHLSGVGVPDYCDLLIVPQSGKAKTTPGYIDKNKGYGSHFSHLEEKASPGYYKVKLKDENIDVRLTTSERAGLHEYTFLNKKDKKYILIDLDHRDQLLDQSIDFQSDKKNISGYRISNAWATNQHFYFYLNLSTPFVKAKRIEKNGQHKLLLTFPASTEKLLIRVGISAVDLEGAKMNVNKEIPDFDFNAVRSSVSRKWNEELGKIDFQSTDKSVMTNFYTALYHTFLQPNLFSDIDGRYRGRDNAIHLITDNIPQYTVFSLWDTYRATHPLYTIVQQKRTNEFIETFLRQFEQGKDLPVWELAGNETECMIGYHSVSVIADAYVKGLRNYNATLALEAMKTTSQIDELGKKQFHEKGFINSGDEPESVSKSLEYAYDDFCIAAMAQTMNQDDDFRNYSKSALNFLNLYDPNTKFMRARRGGLWYSPFEPSEVNFNYTEANSWQYSLYAPHAVDVLSTMMGGNDTLEAWLDKLFNTNMKLSGRDQVDITGLIGQYAHGNEPSHHMAYLYNYTNHPEKTQFYCDRILKEMYSPLPEGLSGNEDCGQMSAWYVLSAMGFYQIAPGQPFYDFGRPLLDEATIHLESGKKLIIKALNNSIENKYIQSIQLNGARYDTLGISHSTLMTGGELVFIMGEQPSTIEFFHPGSYFKMDALEKTDFVPVPFFSNDYRIFEDSLFVKIDMLPSNSHARYKVEYRFPEQPEKTYTYSTPFKITSNRRIEARTIVIYSTKNETTTLSGDWVVGDFIKRDKSVNLKLETDYAPQYSASGPNSLIDGIQGGKEFRTGEYQGFWNQDIVAEVSFDSARVLSEIGISCLQDMKSWIFFPSETQMEISYDGTHFESLPAIYTNLSFASNAATPEVIPSFSSYVGPMKMEFFRKTLKEKAIKKIRITAKNYGQCPGWHLGAGSDTWLFADELIFR